MLDVRYESSEGRDFYFRANNNLINNSDIRDYEWEYTNQFQKVVDFDKSLSTRSIPVTFFQRRSGMENELYTNATLAYELFDRDVMMMKPGKLWIESGYAKGYYIECYIIGSKKTEYDNGVVIKTTLTVLSDFKWKKTMWRFFGTTHTEPGEDTFLDYEHDTPYDYGTNANITSISEFQNEAIAPFDFQIVFYGPWETPTITVGGQIYRVYTSVGNNEYLVVNSIRKAVYITDDTHYVSNEFHARDRENYIFRKMPVSNHLSEVEVPENKVVQIVAFIERSEPKWI